jgi:hypothetical protein
MTTQIQSEMKPQTQSEEERDRLWEHGMHAEDIFYNQLNFLFVFESVLFGTVVALLAGIRITEKLVLVVIGFGLLLTLIWGYIWFRQGYIFDKLKKQLITELPEYRETIRSRKIEKQFPYVTLKLVAAITIILIMLAWFGLIFLVFAN